MAEMCRNCYDLETKIRDLETEAAENRVHLRTIVTAHAEELAGKDRVIAEMDDHARLLGLEIQQFDRFYADCRVILSKPSAHSMLEAVLKDYERLRGSGNAPLEVVSAR